MNAAHGSILSTTISVYTDEPAVVFEQFFYVNISTGLKESAKDSFASAFPSIAIPATSPNVGAMQWFGGFINNGGQGPVFGPLSSISFSGGELIVHDASYKHPASMPDSFPSRSTRRCGRTHCFV